MAFIVVQAQRDFKFYLIDFSFTIAIFQELSDLSKNRGFISSLPCKLEKSQLN